MTLPLSNKYTPLALPKTPEEADALAVEREDWAKALREADKHGSAKEMEFTALLLRAYAEKLVNEQLQ